jgi:hypothetical protein
MVGDLDSDGHFGAPPQRRERLHAETASADVYERT